MGSSIVVRARIGITLIVLALLSSFVAKPVLAQLARPNLTGAWQLNLSKSKLSPYSPRESHGYKIRHLDPRLEVIHIFNGKNETYSYVTDGKERVPNRSAQDGELRAKAYWDGDTLVINQQQDIGPGHVTSMSRYNLSQDGKSLIVTRHVSGSSFGGRFDESLVYDKRQ